VKTFKLVISGVGGQGTLLASRLLAEASIKAGLHVKIGETYGERPTCLWGSSPPRRPAEA